MLRLKRAAAAAACTIGLAVSTIVAAPPAGAYATRYYCGYVGSFPSEVDAEYTADGPSVEVILDLDLRPYTVTDATVFWRDYSFSAYLSVAQPDEFTWISGEIYFGAPFTPPDVIAFGSWYRCDHAW